MDDSRNLGFFLLTFLLLCSVFGTSDVILNVFRQRGSVLAVVPRKGLPSLRRARLGTHQRARVKFSTKIKTNLKTHLVAS